jgi:hypothetical protein
MRTTTPRRARPHPARRARKLLGTLSVAGMFVLTGCMAATTKTAANKSAAGVTTTATSATTATTTPATTATTGTTGTTTGRSVTTTAGSGAVSAQSDTSTNAS